MDYVPHIDFCFSPNFILGVLTPTTTIILGLVLAAAATIYFMVAGSEVAYFSMHYKDLGVLKTKAHPSYKRVAMLLERPRQLQAIFLINRILSGLLVIFIFDILLSNWFGGLHLAEWAFVTLRIVLLLIFIVLFLEFVPRVWATHHKILFAARTSLLLEITGSLFYRYGKNLQEKEFLKTKAYEKKDGNTQENASLDEAIDRLPETEATDAEKNILKGIRKFGDTSVRQIMRPRMDVSGLEENTNFKDVLHKISELHYSRLPVYKNNLDEPLGILHTKDLLPFLNEGENFQWQSIIRKPLFVHEQKLIEDLLQEFLTKRIHFAIVVDEFGGTSGIVTLEDIIEEIVGDIRDDFYEEKSGNKKLDDSNFIFEGKMNIEDALEIMGMPVVYFDDIRGDSNTVGGLVLEVAGEFPAENQELATTQAIFQPLSIVKNRIDMVKITLQKSTETLP